jgi:predicted extracellular nuclease
VNLFTEGYNVEMYFNGNPLPGLTIGLTGTVADDDVYVLAHSGADQAILDVADQTNGAGWFNGDDAVVLRRGEAIIDVIGQIGFDPGTEWGSGLTSTADNTLRRKAAIQAGDPVGSDAFDPAVEWDGFPTNTFDGLGFHSIDDGDSAPAVASTDPTSGAVDVPVDSNVTITFTEEVLTTGDWFSISCSSTGSHTATESGGPQTYTLDPTTDFTANETCTVTVVAANVSDADTDDPPDTMTADHVFGFSTVGVAARIHEIQGAAHLSPLVGERVADVPGIVTVKRSNGFWMQDPNPDADDATSEGIFVFGSAGADAVEVGDLVAVDGTVEEFRPGGTGGVDNLTTTELVQPAVTVESSGNSIAPTVVGASGRMPPTEIIEDDASGDVETSGEFDPAEDGIDFYESLEAMLLQVNDADVVGPRNDFGEIPVLADGGAGTGIRTNRGGIVIGPTDFNPERIILDDTLAPTPTVKVGDSLPGAVVGVLDYSFANFKLLVTSSPTALDGGLQRETTSPPGENELAVATFNVENLDPGDGAAFDTLASLIVQNLQAPDVVAIEEIQDNNGEMNDGTTDASLTWQMLIAAIESAGGPTYDYRQIDPENNSDGGAPGGNIRVGFLFRTDRGLSFVDRPGGDAQTPTGVVRDVNGRARLTLSPGRIDPQHPGFANTRKSLAGEFRWRGEIVIAIANHFSSKGGDDPLFGHWQPPIRSSEVARHQQAQVVNDFVDLILAAQPRANVVVLGDINDFEFSETVSLLSGGVLANLVEQLPKPERYSYVFEGNSQVLDQILVSRSLLRVSVQYDVVHVNSEFTDQASDHDPSVAKLRLD